MMFLDVKISSFNFYQIKRAVGFAQIPWFRVWLRYIIKLIYSIHKYYLWILYYQNLFKNNSISLWNDNWYNYSQTLKVI
jgi:hypothetical protein